MNSTSRPERAATKFAAQDRQSSIARILRAHAERTPGRIAFSFLSGRTKQQTDLTFGSLDRDAARIAGFLRGRGVTEREPIALTFPPGLEFIRALFGCLYAGAIAVPTTDPYRRTRTATRLNSILSDVGPRFGLTVDAIAPKVNEQLWPEHRRIQWFATNLMDSPDPPHEIPDVAADSPALLQYTSGSTASPKGVVLTHRNLIANQLSIAETARQTSESVFVGWLPPYHDMGLIGLILHPVYLGARSVLMSTFEFLQRPFRWLEAISQFRGTASAAPNFAYDLCVDRISDADASALALDSIEVLINGAEPVRPETVERFERKFAAAGLRPAVVLPCYGMAEATLLVTGARAKGTVRFHAVGEPPRRLASCGKPATGIDVAVVNPESRMACGEGETGEIWISGHSVSAGYWNNPAESRATFGAALSNGLQYFRTGDLGFLRNGELFVTGRANDLIIIRGRNIHPEDVEQTAAAAHAACIRNGCAAFSVEAEEGERLVIAQEIRVAGASNLNAIAAAVRTGVAAEHEVEPHSIVLLAPNQIPRTSSGKIQRKASRAMFLNGDWRPLVVHTEAAVERIPLERNGSSVTSSEIGGAILSIIARHVGRDATDLRLSQTIVDLGADSLKALAIQQDIEQSIGAAPEVSEMLGAATISELLDKVNVRLKERRAGVEREPSDGWRPLTPGQDALWFEYERFPRTSAYNIGGAIRLVGVCDRERLRRAFVSILERHAALRAEFEATAAGRRQRIGPARDCYEEVNATGWSESRLRQALEEDLNQPFDLLAGPPYRLRAYVTRGDGAVISLVVSHLVADYLSLNIIYREWMELYQQDGMRLPSAPAPEQYADWYASYLASPRAAEDERYWTALLDKEIPRLDLPEMKAAAGNARPLGGRRSRFIDVELVRELESVAASHRTTLFAALAAALQILLRRYTQQEDIAIAIPTAVRPSSFAAGVAYCVNTVLLHTTIAADHSAREVVAKTRAALLDALDHASYPFANIVRGRRERVDDDAISEPQVAFVYYGDGNAGPAAALACGFGGFQARAGEMSVEVCDGVERRDSQFDLLLSAARFGSGLAWSVEYRDTFEASTIDRMLDHLTSILRGLVANQETPVGELPLLTAQEIEQFERWNDTQTHYPEPHALHQLIDAQSARTPNETAISCEGERLTYAELKDWSDVAARRLLAAGAAPGRPVALFFEPGIRMVVAAVATLKAGSPYLPIDPGDESDRSRRVLDSAGPAVVLTESRLRELLPAANIPIVQIDERKLAPEIPLPPVEPEDLAYIIYTSGSSGEPKGAMISHRAIVNRLLWMRDRYPLGADDRILQKTPYTFDVSVWELFLPLISGVEMVIARPGGFRDPEYLCGLIQRREITYLHFVPSMLRLFLAEPGAENCVSIRNLICSGEALTADLRDLASSKLGARLHNLYGPTEAAVDVTHWTCAREDRDACVPIGHPIANIQLYILDQNHKPVPVGVAGELFIGGVGVGVGYWRKPQLTTRHFFEVAPFGRPVRCYRTGDRARYRADGAIEFLGRIDDQVKIRGIRIEPGEIESALRSHPAVEECAVVAREIAQSRVLVAYLVVRGGPPEVSEFREHLKSRLPDAFVPAVFAVIEALPRTSSGKIRKKALPPPSACRILQNAVPADAHTDREVMLAEIWADVLGVPHVGVAENFFQIGGDSIRSLQARARAMELGYRFSIEQLFQAPTIRELAPLLEPAPPPASRDHTPFSLLPPSYSASLGADIEDAFPLARLQEALVFHSHSDDYEIYMLSVSLDAVFDREILRETLAALASRHAMLRVSYNLIEFDQFIQLAHRDVTIPLEVADWSHLPVDERERQIDLRIEAERHRRFDWTVAPLLRVRADVRSAGSFQLTISHALYDGWSLSTVFIELLSEYAARLRGEPSPLAPIPAISYRDFVELEQQTIQSAAARAFWESQLAGSRYLNLRLPAREKRSATGRVRRRIEIPAETTAGLRALARAEAVPLKSVLLAAHLRVVSFLTSDRDVMTGLITNGRLEEPGGDRTVGLFLNTVPLRIRFGKQTWRTLVRAVFEAEQAMWPHRRFPYSEIRALAGRPPFETGFNFVDFNIPHRIGNRQDIRIAGWKNPSDLTYFPLCAYFTEDPVSARLLFSLDYDARIYDGADLERAAGYYLNALGAAASAPDTQAYGLKFSGQEDSRHALQLRDGAKPEAPAFCLFERRAAEHPDRAAVLAGANVMSYGELNAKANQLANHLKELGVTRETPVGVMLDRTAHMIAGLLAIHKAGGAFVPLNAAMPRERLRMIAADCGLEVILTDAANEGQVPADASRVISLDRFDWASYPADNLQWDVDLESLAYVMFTSGSTGTPKGVEITQRSLSNLLLSIGEEIGIAPGDRWLAVTALSFDISLLEIFLPLVSGCEVALAPADGTRNGYFLANLINSSRPTILQATPSMWRLLLEAGWSGLSGLRALCGGETLTRSLADALLERTATLWNVYGPTETTIWSTLARVEAGPANPTIGGPLANTALYILDEELQPVGPGVPGELYISGMGVARGYRNRPEMNCERFLNDPFSATDGARMYRTGDRVTMDADGTIEYLGRKDNQVKVRGFRVELGEIETHLRRRHAIVEAVVFVRRGEDGEERLIAHLLPVRDAAIEAAELRAHLANVLPAYMIPSEFVMVDSFPLTPNGKVDRVAVEQMESPVRTRPPGMPIPGELTKTEATIAQIWKEVLNISTLRVSDNFFDLGGQSLLLMRATARIQRELAIPLPPMVMFQYPTVESLAAHIHTASENGAETSRRTAMESLTDLAARRRNAWAGLPA